MSFLQFVRVEVENQVAQTGQQQKICSEMLDQIKGYVPKVLGAWTGSDEQEFANDVQRKLVPAMTELIAAIAGITLNLTKATGIIDQADQKAAKLADGWGDMCAQI